MRLRADVFVRLILEACVFGSGFDEYTSGVEFLISYFEIFFETAS